MSPLSRFLRLLPRRRHFSTSLPPSNPNHNPKILHSLYHERDLDRFLSAFHRLSPLPIPLYAVAVRRLDAAGRTSDAAALLRSLQDSLSPSDESAAASLISLYGKARLPDLALDAFRRLPSLGAPRTVLSFNSLLAALDPDRLIQEFNAIPAEDPLIVPNVVSYSILLRAMCGRGDLDGAIACLGTMEEKGVMPNDVTYNTLLNALYKNDRAEEAGGIWGKMEERKCGPNVRSYNAKLRWLVLKGRMADAVRLFREMEGRGLKPDGYSFTAMIMGHCQDGKLDKAKSMLTELRMRNCDPNPWMYDALVPRMCEAGEFEAAVSLCNESMRNKRYMGVGALQGVVDMLVEASRVKDAMKIVKTAWSRHYSRESLIMPPECLQLIETEEQEKMQHEALKRDKKIKADLVPRKASGLEGESVQNESVSSGASAKIGIIVKSFDKPNYLGAFGVPPDKNRVKLPTTRTLITVLRSPHIDKKSREQFEMRVRREYIVIKCRPHELHKKYFWFKRTRILGAQFELVFSYKTRLDMSKLTESLQS